MKIVLKKEETRISKHKLERLTEIGRNAIDKIQQGNRTVPVAWVDVTLEVA